MYIKYNQLLLIIYKMILIAVVCIISVILLYYCWLLFGTTHIDTRTREINITIQRLHKDINAICYRSGISLNYRIEDSEGMTFTEDSDDKYIIHLVVWNDNYKRPYDYNSLIHNTLTEISAITNNNKLLIIAQQLGLYVPENILEITV